MADRVESYPEAKLSRCGRCGQWTWQGACTIHPEATHDVY